MAVVPWVVSGKSVQALAGQAERLLGWAAVQEELSVVDVGCALAGGRCLSIGRWWWVRSGAVAGGVVGGGSG